MKELYETRDRYLYFNLVNQGIYPVKMESNYVERKGRNIEIITWSWVWDKPTNEAIKKFYADPKHKHKQYPQLYVVRGRWTIDELAKQGIQPTEWRPDIHNYQKKVAAYEMTDEFLRHLAFINAYGKGSYAKIEELEKKEKQK